MQLGTSFEAFHRKYGGNIEAYLDEIEYSRMMRQEFSGKFGERDDKDIDPKTYDNYSEDSRP